MLKNLLKHVLGVAMLSSIATFAYAEDAAPVYDADNYPPAFDSQAEVSASALTAGDDAPSSNTVSSLSLDQRMAKAERQINNIQNKDTSAKIDALQTEVQTLRGQVEQLTHQLQQAQTQQRTMYSDLDKRLANQSASSKAVKTTTLASAEPAAISEDNSKIKSALTTTDVKTKAKPKPKITETPSADEEAVVPDVSVKTEAQPNVAEEQQIYQTAYDLIKAKKYNDAILALQKMLQKYPSGQFAANAHYWLGELYGLLEKKDQSAMEFGTVVNNYPESPKVSDAQLKLGLIYLAQFKWADAKAAFKKVINHYPGTASARLAAEQLKQIKEAGH